MRQLPDADLPDDLPITVLTETLAAHPVTFAILFGSVIDETTPHAADIDIAVEFTDLRPGQNGYNDALLSLGADLSEALDTDDIDLLDVHSLSPSVARSVFEEGVLLVGDTDRVRAVRTNLLSDPGTGSPRERYDDALDRIDEHLA
jgi:predicted nucleotidyltransferase